MADPSLGERLAAVQNSTGSAGGPFDAWLTLRGTPINQYTQSNMKTMSLTDEEIRKVGNELKKRYAWAYRVGINYFFNAELISKWRIEIPADNYAEIKDIVKSIREQGD